MGHGTLPAERFVTLVRRRNIDRVVDVRSFPGSRRNPQFGREAMAAWLAEAGIAYEWEQRLGGRRQGSKGPTHHPALTHEAFRAYAAWMETEEFREGLRTLLRPPGATPQPHATAGRSLGPTAATRAGDLLPGSGDASDPPTGSGSASDPPTGSGSGTGARRTGTAPRVGNTAFLCSESLWWRCHRRLLADHLVLVEGLEVRHLFHDGRVVPHEPMAEARVEDGNLVYDGGAASLGI